MIKATIKNNEGPVVKFANSETAELNQSIEANVIFRESSVNIPMFVSDSLPFNALLGIDWCIDSNVVITCDSEKCDVEPTANQIPCNLINTRPTTLNFVTESEITLPARSAQWIQLNTNSNVTGSLILQPLTEFTNIFSIPFAVCSVVQGKTGLYAVNHLNRDISLKKGHKVALSDFSDPEEVNVNTVSTSAESETNFDINPSLPIEEQLRIKRLLWKYARLFKPNEKNRKPKFEHEIELVEEAQSAFDRFKDALSKQPVLIHFQDGTAILLSTDASGFGIGAILSHVFNDKSERVIAYASRSLDDNEKKYGVTEKECLAIVWAILHFRHYLLGRHFTVVTDHHPLCWLHSTQYVSARLTRWIMKLMEFDFTIVHKRGKTHCNVDCLSRYPVTVKTENDNEAFVSTINSNMDIANMQLREPYLNDIIRNIIEHSTKGFKIVDKILYRTVKTEFGDKTLLCLPRKLINYVLSELHDSKESGHLGFDKTINKVRQRFQWKGMSRDVKAYIDSCVQCQKANQKSKMKHGLMQQMPTADPFQIVAIDFAGPLPKTARQNEYIVVLIDFGTRWIEAKALRAANADIVIKFLQESVFLRHSVPKQLISDRGVQFTSSKFQDFLDQHGVKHTQTTAYHPQSNGCVERQNRTLKNIMSKYVASHQKDWDLILPYAVFACNTSEQKSTKQTPFRLLYGRDAVFRIDNLMSLKTNENSRELKENITFLRELAREEIMKSQETNMEYVNRSRQNVNFNEGDIVLQWKPNAEVGKADKLTTKMSGPYKIIRKVSDVNYEIEDIRETPGVRPRKLRDVVHVDRLKLFNERNEFCDELICEDREDRSSLAPTGEESGKVTGKSGEVTGKSSKETEAWSENLGTVCTKGVCDESIQPIEVTVDSDHALGPRGIGHNSSHENGSNETSNETLSYELSDDTEKYESNLFSENSSPLRNVIQSNHNDVENPQNAPALDFDENEYGPPSLAYMGEENEMHSSQPEMPILTPQRVYYRPASHNVPMNQNTTENQSFLSRLLFGSGNNVAQNAETQSTNETSETRFPQRQRKPVNRYGDYEYEKPKSRDYFGALNKYVSLNRIPDEKWTFHTYATGETRYGKQFGCIATIYSVAENRMINATAYAPTRGEAPGAAAKKLCEILRIEAPQHMFRAGNAQEEETRRREAEEVQITFMRRTESPEKMPELPDWPEVTVSATNDDTTDSNDDSSGDLTLFEHLCPNHNTKPFSHRPFAQAKTVIKNTNC
ncbi:hypothetical protein B4U80_10857 [Leptotrombidium deliense]|uniref:RNA-directed DNA polymerase n=1 Tax=Leptotrombidium deliense TaxID=299467 RepID=A0A443SAU2_9ACAR|nr:hypothetical protein B4U80_10857 [Leptotrombidium deliense]